jgi:hypothetical protein
MECGLKQRTELVCLMLAPIWNTAVDADLVASELFIGLTLEEQVNIPDESVNTDRQDQAEVSGVYKRHHQ